MNEEILKDYVEKKIEHLNWEKHTFLINYHDRIKEILLEFYKDLFIKNPNLEAISWNQGILDHYTYDNSFKTDLPAIAISELFLPDASAVFKNARFPLPCNMALKSAKSIFITPGL